MGNSYENVWFATMAQSTAKAAGSSSAFIAICAITLLWLVTLPHSATLMEHGIHMAVAEPFTLAQVVLMDMNMPKLTGLKVLRFTLATGVSTWANSAPNRKIIPE